MVFEYKPHFEPKHPKFYYQDLAIRLKTFIEYFTPSSYREQIRIFDIVPHIPYSDVKKLLKFHIEGKLAESLKHPEINDFYTKKIKEMPCYQEAILKFFQEERFRSHKLQRK